MAKKPNQNEIARAQVYERIAEALSDGLVGMYDKKLRVDYERPDGEQIQFAVALTVSKKPVSASECQAVPSSEDLANGIKSDDDIIVFVETPQEKKETPIAKMSAEEEEALAAAMQDLGMGDI